jgi:rubredoxin
VACWLPKNVLLPRQVPKGRNKPPFWFQCVECGHEFDAKLNEVTNLSRLAWCPFCARKRRCVDDDCTPCFDRSFASFDPVKVACWSSKNILKPRQVAKTCNDVFWFDCHICGHVFDNSLDMIVLKGNWCRYHTSQDKCGDKGCDICYGKSFAAFHDKEKLACWSARNILQPNQVIIM